MLANHGNERGPNLRPWSSIRVRSRSQFRLDFYSFVLSERALGTTVLFDLARKLLALCLEIGQVQWAVLIRSTGISPEL